MFLLLSFWMSLLWELFWNLFGRIPEFEALIEVVVVALEAGDIFVACFVIADGEINGFLYGFFESKLFDIVTLNFAYSYFYFKFLLLCSFDFC